MNETTTADQLAGNWRLRDLIRGVALKVAGQVTDAWGVLAPDEKERIATFAEAQAEEAETEAARRLDSVFDEHLSRGLPAFVGRPKKIAIAGDKVEVTISVPRNEVPEELYLHRSGILLVLTVRDMGLEELHQQRDLFDMGARSEYDIEVDPAYYWIEQFMAHLSLRKGQLDLPIANMLTRAAYDSGGPLHALVELYMNCGWPPEAAVENEIDKLTAIDWRPIADGPPPTQGEAA